MIIRLGALLCWSVVSAAAAGRAIEDAPRISAPGPAPVLAALRARYAVRPAFGRTATGKPRVGASARPIFDGTAAGTSPDGRSARPAFGRTAAGTSPDGRSARPIFDGTAAGTSPDGRSARPVFDGRAPALTGIPPLPASLVAADALRRAGEYSPATVQASPGGRGGALIAAKAVEMAVPLKVVSSASSGLEQSYGAGRRIADIIAGEDSLERGSEEGRSAGGRAAAGTAPAGTPAGPAFEGASWRSVDGASGGRPDVGPGLRGPGGEAPAGERAVARIAMRISGRGLVLSIGSGRKAGRPAFGRTAAGTSPDGRSVRAESFSGGPTAFPLKTGRADHRSIEPPAAVAPPSERARASRTFPAAPFRGPRLLRALRGLWTAAGFNESSRRPEGEVPPFYAPAARPSARLFALRAGSRGTSRAFFFPLLVLAPLSWRKFRRGLR